MTDDTPRHGRGNILLLIAALIWGSAFVAQRVGADAMAPASFTAVRHLLGAFVLLPVVAVFDRTKRLSRSDRQGRWRATIVPGIIIGLALTGGSLLQQAGLGYTTAGNAGFITGLYMVFIPVAGWALFRTATSSWTWLGVGLALVGLFLLSVGDGFRIGIGDLLVLGCAVFWAAHIMTIDRVGRALDSLRLCVVQYVTCAIVCALIALVIEDAPFRGIPQAAIPLAYAAVLSTGVAFTLQVLGQRHAKASHAAMIMSLEAVFAAIGGALWLGETMTVRALLGCALMFSAVLIAQLGNLRRGDEPLSHTPDP